MTNGDKIRSMSNAELLEFIINFGTNNDNCECCAFDFASYECNAKSCKEGISEWLESECKKNE